LGRHQKKLQLRLKVETYYTAFGLSMAGISDKAVKSNYGINKHRFNHGTELQNQEFSDGSGLEWYAATYRSLDPQLGRFWQIDPLLEISEDVSPYSFGNDNPITNIDPLGLAISDSSHPLDLKLVTITPHTNNNSTIFLPLQTRMTSDHPAPRLNYNPTIRVIPAEQANVASGYKYAPYKPGTSVIRYRSSVLGRYVRVYDSKNPRANAVGKWIVKESEIKGLSLAQIKDKLALENLPDKMVEVKVPAGTNMEESVAGENEWGNGGAMQYNTR
jgi:RHS repeat-associated protein